MDKLRPVADHYMKHVKYASYHGQLGLEKNNQPHRRDSKVSTAFDQDARAGLRSSSRGSCGHGNVLHFAGPALRAGNQKR
jgi:hypothetical protein